MTNHSEIDGSQAPGRSAVAPALAELLADRSTLSERFAHFQSAFHDEGLLPPRLLELCRIRVDALHQQPVASSLGAATADAVARGDFAELSATEQLVLALAEQLTIDVHGVSDEQMAEVVAALGEPATVTLLTGVAMHDANVRMQKVLAPLAVARASADPSLST